MREIGPVKGRRRPKQSRDQLRALLLEAGRSLLVEEGLGAAASSLTFKTVFERVQRDTGIRLTNASVIRRVWENQADYQADVLAAIAGDEGGQEFEETVGALRAVLDVDLADPESRARAMRQVCRIGGGESVRSLRESKNWALGTAEDLPEGQKRIQVALLDGYEAVTELWEEAYGLLAGLLGLRLREPLTLRQFTIACGALAEGCSLRQRVDDRLEGILLPTGPHGEDEEWALFAIGLEALLRQFFEPDPGWIPDPESAAQLVGLDRGPGG
jgi:hypothetical protein